MAEIKQIERIYSKDYREVFEDIATLMFCTELGLEKGVNRRLNQRAIESDPVLIDGKWYAYQAKYYDASTRLSDHKRDLIKCIEGAANRNVTDLFLYINKNLPDTNLNTGEEVEYIREIEDVASQHSVILYWRTLSMMEASLDMPKYTHIKNLYFGHGNIKGYYDYVVTLYEKPFTGNTLLGEESLAELYMQPSYYKSNDETGDVDQLLDNFISKGDHGVFWIVGQPGHGKTSMCIKAVADYKSRKLYQQAKGVFWFRLNPQGIPEMVKPKMLALEKVFSWGRITGNRTNMIEPGEIEGSLVFLDGFDELKSSLEEHGISSNQFYEQVNQLAQAYQMHIVVTSRTRALEQGESWTEEQLKKGNNSVICKFRDGSSRKNDVVLLAPLSSEKQTLWIEDLINWKKHNNENTSALENYRQKFLSLQNNEEIAGLLEVPILLRMIVQNCFEPSSGNRVDLYRDLFDMTLLRQGLEDQRDELHSIYRKIAFKIFVYNDDSAKIYKKEFSGKTGGTAYLYQYYLHTPEKETEPGKDDIYRVSFLHRSFYQYFLSEFFYEKLKSVTDSQGGENFLKYLWPRHMDPYVLDNLSLRAKSEDIDYMPVFKAIDETDAFLYEYKNSSGSKEPIGNYDKANTAFWNAISACNSIFLVEDSQKKMELTGRVIELLSKYTCSGILLRNSFLSDTNLSRADLCGVQLIGSNLRGANLSGANLISANLRSADLRSADLRSADLCKAYLSDANLSRANLSDTNLSKAVMIEADLSDANLSRANLSDANLSKADLSKAVMIEADLSDANLSKANLREASLFNASLSRADLSGADLSGAYMINAYMIEADLNGAVMIEADLGGVNLNGADLRGANLSGADLSVTDLSAAYLIKTDLSGADLSEADLMLADLSGADLSGADLSGADLMLADLGGADLSGAELRSTNLHGANLNGADLSNADLSGTNLSQADLSETCLVGANLNGADLSGTIWDSATPPKTKS